MTWVGKEKGKVLNVIKPSCVSPALWCSPAVNPQSPILLVQTAACSTNTTTLGPARLHHQPETLESPEKFCQISHDDVRNRGKHELPVCDILITGLSNLLH